MALTGTTSRLTAAERAREPRSLGVLAYYDGYTQAAYPETRKDSQEDYPRLLNAAEAESWREGWREGHRERTCIDSHGFPICTETDPPHHDERTST